MKGAEALTVMTDLLNREEIAYMVVGSFSSNYHGIPRSTKDADLVIRFEERVWATLEKNLPEGMILDPQGGFEMVTATRKEVVSLNDSAFEIELFHLSEDPFDEVRFERRMKVNLLDGGAAWVATAEDVVIQKLRWAKGGQRSKDFDDVVNVLLRKGERLDFAHIEKWCGEHGTLALLAEAREAAT